MAQFQQIRPELGRMDFSPIERGGRAFGQGVGQGLASLGAGIGSAVARHREKVADEERTAAAIGAMEDMGYTSDEAKSVVKSIGPKAVGSFVAGLHDLDRRMKIDTERRTRETQAIATALQGSYLPQTQEAIERGEQPQVDWPTFITTATELGASPASVKSFVGSAESTGLKEPDKKDFTTQDIEGTDYVAIIQPSGAASVVPKSGTKPKESKPTPEDEYNLRADAAKSAFDKGVLTEEQYQQALDEAKKDVYGLPSEKGFSLVDLLQAQMLGAGAVDPAANGWSAQTK